MDNIITTAYHEAGHGLLAYIVGWSVTSINLNIQNGDIIYGVTKYNFGNDKIDNHINLNRRILCLMGGPISQAIHENRLMIDIDTLGEDGKTIDLLLSHLHPLEREKIIQESINATANLLSIRVNKTALNNLAEKLTNNHQILESDFIQLLDKFGIHKMNF